jgi:hypothetical protein
MRAIGLGAGVLFFALSGCMQTQTTGSIGATSSGGPASTGSTTGASTGNGSTTGTSGGQGSTAGTSGGSSTSGGSNPCTTRPPCPPGLVCDPDKNGACECYLGGPACGPTQICDADGGCINDPCFGVTCTAPGAACFGGECKCGGPNGVLCSAPGESCSPIDNSCGPTASCAITPCPTNSVCNPQDGVCHCGSMMGVTCPKQATCVLWLFDGGPLAPGEDAGEAAVYGLCSTEDPCHGVICPPFEACDVSNNGACECGGAPDMNIPGTVCTSDQACVDPFDGGTPTCMQACQPFGVACGTGESCDYFPASLATVCAPPTGDAGAESYCDVFPDGGPTSTPPPDGGTHGCAPGSVCTPLPAGIVAGTCQPG